MNELKDSDGSFERKCFKQNLIRPIWLYIHILTWLMNTYMANEYRASNTPTVTSRTKD